MATYIGPHGQRRATVDGSAWDRHVAGLPGWRRDDGETPEGGPPVEPALNASRDAWVKYARLVAHDTDETESIDGLTRDELIDRFAGRTDENG